MRDNCLSTATNLHITQVAELKDPRNDTVDNRTGNVVEEIESFEDEGGYPAGNILLSFAVLMAGAPLRGLQVNSSPLILCIARATETFSFTSYRSS